MYRRKPGRAREESALEKFLAGSVISRVIVEYIRSEMYACQTFEGFRVSVLQRVNSLSKNTNVQASTRRCLVSLTSLGVVRGDVTVSLASGHLSCRIPRSDISV